MRILKLLALLAGAFAFAGCDKAGALFGAGSGLDGGNETADPGGDPDPTLAGLVSRSVDGVMFRRDIDFPSTIKGRVRVTRSHKSYRIVESSALGNETRVINHRTETEITFEKQPGNYRMKLLKSGRRLLEKNEEAVPEATTVGSLEGESLEFILTEAGWKQSGDQAGQFKKAIWADALTVHVPQLMVEAGAHPRVQWFSSSRCWQAGDRIVLTGSSAKMLIPFDVTGRVELVFEGEEAVGGHPCGVFSLSGDLSVREQAMVDGRIIDNEISISDGKIWASLLHPILMREEYECVETATEGSGNGAKVRMQGGVNLVRSRAWQPDAG